MTLTTPLLDNSHSSLKSPPSAFNSMTYYCCCFACCPPSIRSSQHQTNPNDSTHPDGGPAAGYSSSKYPLRQLTCSDRLRVMNMWTILSTAGNVFVLIYTFQVMILAEDIITDELLRVSLGLACLFYWIGIVQYLEFDPRYYVLILTLKTGIPRVFKFLVRLFGSCLYKFVPLYV